MELLKQEGYNTVGVGKMHFHPITRMAGYDRRIIADQKEAAWLDDDYAKFLKANGRNVNRIYKQQGPDEIPRVYDFPDDERLHIDHYVGQQARQIVENRELKDPWFLWVSFNGPHSPWDPPAQYSAPYKAMKLPECNYRPGELGRKPANHTFERYVYTRAVMDMADHYPQQRAEIFHRMRAAHYGNLTFIDRQVEQLLAAFDKQGGLDDTIVIYSADHGSCLGDHDIVHKGTHLERSAHVPFVVRWPRRFEPRRIEGFSGHVDLLPTILSLVSAPIPKAVEGTDLSPLLFGTRQSVQDQVFIEIRNDTSIVTEDWKLSVNSGPWLPTQWPIRDGDLYDRKKDSTEQVNLYGSRAHAAIQRQLTDRILAFNPKLAEKVGVPIPPTPPVPVEYSLKQGDFLGARTPMEPPHQEDKAVTITAKITPPPSEPLDGFIVNTHAGPHGYSLCIRDGLLLMGVRIWNSDTIIKTVLPVPSEAFRIEAHLARDGAFTLKIDGKKVAEGKAPGCIPLQPGRRIRLLAGEIRVGAAAPAGVLSNAALAKQKLRGTISDMRLTLS